MTIFPIEYLIANEDNIDWNLLSKRQDTHFNTVEIRLFRKKINWQVYLMTHKDEITDIELEEAVPVFSEREFSMIAKFNIGTDIFIKHHPEKFNFKDVILYHSMSPEVLLECKNYWMRMPYRKNIFKNAREFDILSDPYLDVRVVLELF